MEFPPNATRETSSKEEVVARIDEGGEESGRRAEGEQKEKEGGVRGGESAGGR